MPDHFCELVLHQHNDYRRKHGAPDMTLTEELCRLAQGHAEEMAKTQRMVHTNTHFGENLYTMTSSKPIEFGDLAERACKAWYSEKEKHKFDGEPKNLSTSHFTQMVWCDTTELGVGHAITKNGTYYVVCNYNPAGNYIGKYVKNVHPLKN